jgi:hypothetical protein
MSDSSSREDMHIERVAGEREREREKRASERERCIVCISMLSQVNETRIVELTCKHDL